MKVNKMMCCAAVSMAAGLAFSQGVLVPPGAPEATMKTLSEIDTAIAGVNAAVVKIESRIDVATLSGNATSATSHYILDSSGSYYLSGNLEVTKDVGISVKAVGVTLDLNGFTISRSGAGGTGIDISILADDCVVFNGTIRGFETGIDSEGESSLFKELVFSECTEYGLSISVDYSASAWVQSCRTVRNTGIGISAGPGSSLFGCIVENNEGTHGVLMGAGSSIVDCVSRNNTGVGIEAGNGSSVVRCVASGNSSTGIKVGADCALNECVSKDNGGTGLYIAAGCSLAECISNGNGQSGVYSPSSGCALKGCLMRDNQGSGAYLSSNNSVIDCSVFSNSGTYGIYASSRTAIQGCTVSYNESSSTESSGIKVGDGSTVRECVVRGNSNTHLGDSHLRGGGIVAGDGSLVADCNVCENEGDGILVADNCQVIGNQCHYNGLYGASGAGIYTAGSGNRIAENQMTANDFGLQTLAGVNVVTGNSAAGNTTDYSLSGTQLKGAMITTTGTIATKDAWANFEF